MRDVRWNMLSVLGMVVLAAGLPALAAAATPDYPVIATPAACTANCSGLPGMLTPTCTRCLYTNGAINAWSAFDPSDLCDGEDPVLTLACLTILRSAVVQDSPIGKNLESEPLQRLALYELGYTSMPGVPLLKPERFTDPILYSGTILFAEGILANNFQYGPTGIEVCYPTGSGNATKCDTRDAGSSLGSLSIGGIDLYLGCIAKQGWLSPDGAATGACPFNFEKLTATDVALNTPQQLAMMYPSTRNRTAWMATAQKQAVAYYTDVTAAQDSLWGISHNLYASTLYYKNVTSLARIATLKKLYGSQWNSAWDRLAAAGKLVELDLTYMAQFVPLPVEGAGPASVNLAAHALLQYNKIAASGNINLRTLALALGNFPNGTNATVASGTLKLTVYTPQLSKTAFIFAMAMMRSVFMQQIIWAGHVYHFHILQGAVSYSLYNTIDAGVPVGLSSHPVRQLLDPYLDPAYLTQFNTALFAKLIPPPPTPVTPADTSALPQFLELYAKAGPLGNATLYACHPKQQLAASGLNPSLFTTPKGPSWDQYPLAGVSLQVLELCTTAAAATLSQYYSSDATVAQDAEVQAWVTAMLATNGGNLRRINSANAVVTRQQLYDLAGYLLFTSIAHATSHLQDYTLRTLSMAHLPPLLNTTTLPNPRAAYSTQHMVAATTNTDTYGREANFIFAFIGTQPWTQFVPGDLNMTSGSGTPQYEEDLPFTGQGELLANAAIVVLRQSVSTLLANTQQSPLIRMTGTNWGGPLVLPRVIDI